MLKRLSRFFLLAWLACSASSQLSAYEPSVDEIVTRFLAKTAPVTRVIVEIRSTVFDPFSGEPAPGDLGGDGESLIPGVGGDEVVPLEQPEREFVQVTYWIRNSFLAVETFSTGGELLHFYLSEKFRTISRSLRPDRPFSDSDVLSPYLPFLEAGRESWREGLDQWGVLPRRVEFIRTPKGVVLFNLVEGPGRSVWVDRLRHRPLRIRTVIEGGERPARLTIEFGEFLLFGGEEEGWLMFPRTTNFLLDGRLFKQSTVKRFESEPAWSKFPLTRLRRKGRELLEAVPADGPEREEG